MREVGGTIRQLMLTKYAASSVCKADTIVEFMQRVKPSKQTDNQDAGAGVHYSSCNYAITCVC